MTTQPGLARWLAHTSPEDAVAVVGLSCRFPGAADPDAYWALLTGGRDEVRDLPAERARLMDQDGHGVAAGSLRGGFLDDVDTFDPEFFGISPREAAATDPQQRLALELAWEAVEHAGIPAAALRDHRAGVFLGAAADDHAKLAHARGPAAVTRHSLTGRHRSLVAHRISHTLGLAGPSLVVDAGASSSLVAVHLAVESLRSGESTFALAGGVNLALLPEGFLMPERLGALSPDGRCHTFDARANGYVRGEGGGMVVLTTLERALADGLPVHCVIRGSAVSNDGGGSLAAPGPTGHVRALRSAYARARVNPADVRFVELHGAGTPAGDPVEAEALGQVLGTARGRAGALLVGSVKTNIGHLEGAAGIAGLIKAVLCVRERTLAPSLHFRTPHPRIPLDRLNLEVTTEVRALDGDRPLLAGVSSLAVGGTHCHVVLAEGPPAGPPTAPPGPAPGTPVPVLLSARSAGALRDQAERLGARLAAHPRTSPADAGWSTSSTRSVFEHRAVVVAGERTALASGLAALARGEGDVVGTAGDAGRTVWVFPGRGAPWAGVAGGLGAACPPFRDRLAQCAEALRPWTDWSLWDALADEALLGRVDVAQPALWAVTVSLAAAWEAYGVVPDAVVGHGHGEIAAACVAGGLPLSDGARLVALRGRALAGFVGCGATVSVGLTPSRTQRWLARWGGRLVVAEVNGPASVVVSGERTAVAELAEEGERRGVPVRRLPLGDVSHTPMVEQVRERLLEAAGSVRARAGRVPFLSTATGGFVDTSTLDAEYWYRNLREPVEFARATRALVTDGHRTFLEMSPHPALTAPVRETLDGCRVPGVVTGTLRRGDGGLDRLLTSVGEAWVRGVTVDWSPAFRGPGPHPRRIDLPTYPFQRRRHWLPATPAPGVAAAGLTPLDHPVLRAALAPAGSATLLLTGRLTADAHPWLTHPAAGDAAPLELALHAGAEAGTPRVDDLTVHTSLTVPASGAVRVQVQVGPPAPDGRRPVQVHTCPDGDATPTWTRHADGHLAPATAEPGTGLAQWPSPDTGSTAPGDPAHPALRAVWPVPGGIRAEAVLDDVEWADAERFALHPGLLAAALTAVRAGDGPAGTVRWQGVDLHAVGATAVRVAVVEAGRGHTVTLADGLGAPVATVEAVELRAAGRPVTAPDQGAAPRPPRRTLRRAHPAGADAGGEATVDGLWQRIAGLAEPERALAVSALVRRETALVRGQVAGALAEADTGRSFTDLGFDSLMGVELRNRLVRAAGAELPRSLVHDHPTPEALIRHLDALAGRGPDADGSPGLGDVPVQLQA